MGKNYSITKYFWVFMAQCHYMEIIMKDICARLIELRKENGFSQQYVANYLKIDRSNYSKYELGKLEINVPMVIALSKLYKVSTDYILCQTEY